MLCFKSMRSGLSVLFVAGVGLCTPCTDFPYAKLEEVLHSNLGGYGPDSGKEGLLFKISLKNVGIPETEAEFHVHADANGGYVPDWNVWNGLNGEWGRINLHSGASASFTAHFVKTGTDTPLTLHRGYMTFGDLDGGATEKEFVAVSPFFQYYFTGFNTWLKTDTSIPGFQNTFTFNGQEVEMGFDNPPSGEKIIQTQKLKTVTLQAHANNGVQEVKFKLGATPGQSSRTIQFNLQATMLCALTQMPDGTEKDAFDASGPYPLVSGNGETGKKVEQSDVDSGNYDICTLADCDHAVH